MPLKTDFDRRAYRKVLAHALGGALIGLLPGAAAVALSQDHLAQNSFALALMQLGGSIGAIVGGVAAAAGCIVSAVRSRGSGPGRMEKMKAYQPPEPLPPVPGPTKRPETAKKDVPESPPPGVTSVAPPTPSVPLVSAPAPPGPPPFEDYDRPTSGHIS